MPDEEPWDLVVAGGGAAGFFGAITAAENMRGQGRVLILEKSSQLLGKVKISGGGRCNVTHACFDPRLFASHFPRGEKELIGPLHRWDAQSTIDWFENRGVELKTEADGRMFPKTDDSQTIIDCLMNAASKEGITIRTRTTLTDIKPKEDEAGKFVLNCSDGKKLISRNLLLATGGTRSADSEGLIQILGHKMIPSVPSLFTFNIPAWELKDLAGLSVKNTEATITEFKLGSTGPALITHWGLSGPAILKLSAKAARVLHSVQYSFSITINWLPGIPIMERFDQLRSTKGKRLILSHSPFPELPKRLWQRLVAQSGIQSATTWSQASKKQIEDLVTFLTKCPFKVHGKSMNKEEFVTCGGVELGEINLRTMESRLHPGLYFAGEVMNIDGITGGFNFQSAWTTGHLAGIAIAMD
jgi:hypothetical protein